MIQAQIANLKSLVGHQLFDSKLKEFKETLAKEQAELTKEFFIDETISVTKYLFKTEALANYLMEIPLK